MTKPIATLSEIKKILAEPGATLVRNQRHNAYPAFWVERANGQRIACGKVADRLTWGGPKSRVVFDRRGSLEIFYTPRTNA